MISWMLDTDTCIYIIKKKPAKVLETLRRQPLSSVGISTITLSELEYGVAHSSNADRNRIALSTFLAPLEVLAFDDMAARAYGALRNTLQRQGTPIGAMDMLIAAHALSTGCTLVTNNEREFRRVEGLVIENWTS